jgi:hypothetical protein
MGGLSLLTRLGVLAQSRQDFDVRIISQDCSIADHPKDKPNTYPYR